MNISVEQYRCVIELYNSRGGRVSKYRNIFYGINVAEVLWYIWSHGWQEESYENLFKPIVAFLLSTIIVVLVITLAVHNND